jgi:peroxiredoxin
MRGKIFFYFLFVIFIFLLNLPFAAEGGQEDLFSKIKISPIKGDKKAPDFSLKDLTGEKVELGQFKGKVIFLNFWATWCSPCKEEMPSMEVLYQQFKEKNFILLTISVDYGGLKPVQEFINTYHYTFPVLLDPKCKTLNLFQVKGIPTTFIIDKKGRIVGKAVGPRDWKSPEVISLINLLIEK